jgi:hypothetical protein
VVVDVGGLAGQPRASGKSGGKVAWWWKREYEMRQQPEIENASLAESLPNLTWMLLLNKGMLSHEPKGEKSKTVRGGKLLINVGFF